MAERVAFALLMDRLHSGEAAALAQLRHPNIVQIYDVGEAARRPYFAFEFVVGGSLAQYFQGMP